MVGDKTAFPSLHVALATRATGGASSGCHASSYTARMHALDCVCLNVEVLGCVFASAFVSVCPYHFA